MDRYGNNGINTETFGYGEVGGLMEIGRKVESVALTLAEEVHPIYELLGWEWTNPQPRHIPTVKEISDTLVELYKELRSSKLKGLSDSISTGGLKVYRCLEEDKWVHYYLIFQISKKLEGG